jgi:hypothetical protein
MWTITAFKIVFHAINFFAPQYSAHTACRKKKKKILPENVTPLVFL